MVYDFPKKCPIAFGHVSHFSIARAISPFVLFCPYEQSLGLVCTYFEYVPRHWAIGSTNLQQHKSHESWIDYLKLHDTWLTRRRVCYQFTTFRHKKVTCKNLSTFTIDLILVSFPSHLPTSLLATKHQLPQVGIQQLGPTSEGLGASGGPSKPLW